MLTTIVLTGRTWDSCWKERPKKGRPGVRDLVSQTLGCGGGLIGTRAEVTGKEGEKMFFGLQEQPDDL